MLFAVVTARYRATDACTQYVQWKQLENYESAYNTNMNTTSSPTSPSFRKSINACPPTPRLYHQLVDFKGEPVPSFPKLKSAGKASAQEQEGTLISKKPEGLHFLMTPCSLRSLLPNETYYTKFGECKSTNSQDSKSNKRLRKVSFDLEPRIFQKNPSDAKTRKRNKL